MNNIFKYAPKELVTDAFLAWYIKELDENQDLRGKASIFFYELGLCDTPKKSISEINVKKQENNTDLIIRYLVDGNKTEALFENKTYTSAHSDQLERYAREFKGFKYFKYMKLGYINYEERRNAEKLDYEVIDVYRLKSALDKVSFNNVIADQYREFLDDRFVTFQDKIKNELIKENKYNFFEDSQAQQYILSKLHKTIDGLNPDINFKFAANSGGTPWTQLDIAKRENAYSDLSEYLFWRIDTRGKGFYLRLNQYSSIDLQFWPQKKANLKVLRENIAPLLARKGIKLGEVSDRGKKESEIVILFFEDNHLKAVSEHLPELSKEIYEFYSSYINWE